MADHGHDLRGDLSIWPKAVVEAELDHLRRMAEMRRPTRERGLSHFTMRLEDWEKLGCPAKLVMSDGSHVPIYPTGRKPNWYGWKYRKIHR